jgi:hypothetical protein
MALASCLRTALKHRRKTTSKFKRYLVSGFRGGRPSDAIAENISSARHEYCRGRRTDACRSMRCTDAAGIQACQARFAYRRLPGHLGRLGKRHAIGCVGSPEGRLCTRLLNDGATRDELLDWLGCVWLSGWIQPLWQAAFSSFDTRN